jgi:hypothetical protein
MNYFEDRICIRIRKKFFQARDLNFENGFRFGVFLLYSVPVRVPFITVYDCSKGFISKLITFVGVLFVFLVFV